MLKGFRSKINQMIRDVSRALEVSVSVVFLFASGPGVWIFDTWI